MRKGRKAKIMKIIKFLFSPAFMGILFLVFAVSMAAATFLGNDLGFQVAWNFVYGTHWFELILLLLSVNMAGQLIILKLYRKTKLTVFIFHFAFILIIAGAGITRYFGREGTIHIREGQEQGKYLTNEKYLGYSVKDNKGKILSQGSQKYLLTNKTAENYRKKLSFDGKEYEINLVEVIPNATETVADSPSGRPVISLVLSDSTNREQVFLKEGEMHVFEGLSIGLDADKDVDFKITSDAASFSFQSKFPVSEVSMADTLERTIGPGQSAELDQLQIITVGNVRIIAREMAVKGIIKTLALSRGMQNTGKNVLVFNLLSGGATASTLTLWDDMNENNNTCQALIDGKTFELSFGPREESLPFSLKLNKFILERYPGSSSPSGYKSDVILKDKAGKTEMPYMIFMNNILKYRGYRIFQASYDQDEKGTVLSVNHDPAGMAVTYTGYGLLFLFIIFSLLNRKSVFYTVKPGLWSSSFRKTVPVMLILLVLSGTGNINAQKLVPGRESAEEFGKVLVQDQKGRTKPLFTLSNDILRKVARDSKFEGLTPMQVFLGIYLDFDNWKEVPLIWISNKTLQNSLGIKGNMASFSDIVTMENGKGTYKLAGDVSNAYSKSPGERTSLDKEVMKVNERINIIYMIYSGDLFKIFPLKDGSHNWGSPPEALKTAVSREDSLYLSNIIPLFAEALKTNNSVNAKQIANSVHTYQKTFTKYDLPSESKSKAEHLYYRLMIFERLFPFYATIGLIMLIGLIVIVIRGKKGNSLIVKILSWVLFGGFLLHTFGIGLRWYIAGHAPMSNGYESMIFISWVTLLAGFLFSRRSPFALAATAVLASMTLMVAHLSFMDPEITNLVPVLKSYWLTLHVSVITGSYGFLGLGAVLSIITMVLMSFSNGNNRERISNTIDELVVLNYKTLTLGLCFLTIGTFLGAVWANESWGNYWGWDPKETWSLITIVVYSFVLHSRLIPGMKDIYSFNFLSLFAFSSVLMTYFGVNYYLSGMHSYASGEAAPVPAYVYIAVILLAGLCLAAYIKYRKLEKPAKE
jgi:cytochrome c-type biogenesis protein CcsB